MGKRKGKSRIYPTEPGQLTSTGPMDSFVTKGVPELSESFPLGGAEGAGAPELSPGLSTTLSPDGRRSPPPQPNHHPQLQTTPGIPLLEESSGEEAARRAAEAVTCLTTRDAVVTGQAGVEQGSGGTEKMLLEMKDPDEDANTKRLLELCTQKPKEVTLECLWDFFSEICKVIVPQITNSQQKLAQLEKIISVHENTLSTNNSQISDIQSKMDALKIQQEVIVKDNTALRFKIENMENVMRATNLRFLNFPKLPMIGAKEMFKRYVVENLNVSIEKVPSIMRAYYLPTGKKKPMASEPEQLQEKNLEMDTLDLTTFLETSDSEQAIPSTMIVVFTSVGEKDWLFRTFFKNREKAFLNLKISIFPDLSRETQRRRKQFLSFKQAVLQIGALFFLRFPCKCMIKYKSIKYIFFDPEQLASFLSSKSCVSSTPSALAV